MGCGILLTTIVLILVSLAGDNTKTSADSGLVSPVLDEGGLRSTPTRNTVQTATGFSSAYTALIKCRSGLTAKEEKCAADEPDHYDGNRKRGRDRARFDFVRHIRGSPG